MKVRWFLLNHHASAAEVVSCQSGPGLPGDVQARLQLAIDTDSPLAAPVGAPRPADGRDAS
ncbi:hypothetical protein GCM10023082_59280 [Streptomyces tremellae]|uniref:Uncharacterized protein n=1 Tax=Streptomyces tremellae TaxID=1124239 RepID=A0ABP7GB10_9ACTN